jgi:acyl-coenzyme A synthetase/AMP-(fatty) acid ligase
MAADYEQLCAGWNPWDSIPHSYNLGAALTYGQVTRHPDKLALLWENAAGRAESLTYLQLQVFSERLGAALRRFGVRSGDRVFLRLPNVPEFYIAALAVLKCGAIFIPSSTQLREEEVRYRLNDAGAVAVITTSSLADCVERVRSQCPTLRHLIVVSDDKPGAETLDFWKWVRQCDETFVHAPTHSHDPAFIAYTSGTTGEPKGVVHAHRYPLGYEALIRFWHDYRPNDIVACPSEMGWLLPVACTFLYAFAKGLTVVLYDGQGGRFDPETWFRLFQKYRITNFTAAPTVYRMLLAQADAAKHYDLSSWRHGVSAGEALPADTLGNLKKHFGVTVLDGIGMTECMVYCYNMVGQPLKPGSCGRPGPGTHIELVDDDLNPVPVGQPGVLCVRRDTHPGMMLEYWRKPGQTAEIFRGPWYYSGDVLVRDEDGYLWFQGRNDDLIKASGYRIAPFEVESCLVAHPAVLEAAAVESPDPVRGRVVKAFVLLREGVEPTDALKHELQEWAKQHMAGYKYPRKIEFVEALPKTTSGKIKRRELRQLEFATTKDSKSTKREHKEEGMG